jgi:hypothetical protein
MVGHGRKTLTAPQGSCPVGSGLRRSEAPGNALLSNLEDVCGESQPEQDEPARTAFGKKGLLRI